MASNKRPQVTIHNVPDDTYEIREMNDFEYAQYLVDIERDQAQKAEVQAKENARQSALAKLAALGLTEDEIAAL